uniref:Uncharacterized protein n=1 Tax=Bicosoecida sp. CB-2014 TaxID=1486930 RepID=A0A6T6U1X1_9STRA|mmetsp:Transcript_11693/g.40946  ORF Transcript_11693/g.40946 Transcript_11693/m.40946 type:complete len:139 (+) Transcript_11693:120-536(+)
MGASLSAEVDALVREKVEKKYHAAVRTGLAVTGRCRKARTERSLEGESAGRTSEPCVAEGNARSGRVGVVDAPEGRVGSSRQASDGGGLGLRRRRGRWRPARGRARSARPGYGVRQGIGGVRAGGSSRRAATYAGMRE